MGGDNPFIFPITGERLERLRARREDGTLANPEEWAQLIRQETEPLKGFLRYKLRSIRNSEALVKDILQRTWLDLINKVGPSDQRQEDRLTRSYLRATAWGAMTATWRDSRFDHGRGDIDPDADILNRLESAAFASEAEILADFQTMLNKARPPLTEPERQIMEKRFIGGMTFKEIAAELELPLGTVTTAYYRALEKILAGLPDNPPYDMDP